MERSSPVSGNGTEYDETFNDSDDPGTTLGGVSRGVGGSEGEVSPSEIGSGIRGAHGDREFKTGDQVLLWDAVRAESREDKFSVRWIGPFTIDERVSDHLWRLRRDQPRGPGRKARMVYHSDHLRHFPIESH